jgi:hypothetical protein
VKASNSSPVTPNCAAELALGFADDKIVGVTK